MRVFIALLRAFFGTPRRALATIMVMVACAIVEKFFPGVLGEYAHFAVRAMVVPVVGAVLRLTCELLGPFLQPILTLAIVALGYRVMWRGFRGR